MNHDQNKKEGETGEFLAVKGSKSVSKILVLALAGLLYNPARDLVVGALPQRGEQTRSEAVGRSDHDNGVIIGKLSTIVEMKGQLDVLVQAVDELKKQQLVVERRLDHLDERMDVIVRSKP